MPDAETRFALPPATPSWVTPELVALTLRVWQPRYASTLTIDDAIAMIVNAGRLFGVLWPRASRDPLGESGGDSSRAV